MLLPVYPFDHFFIAARPIGQALAHAAYGGGARPGLLPHRGVIFPTAQKLRDPQTLGHIQDLVYGAYILQKGFRVLLGLQLR